MAVKTSVIIVDYRARREVERLKNCLRELKNAEIIVIDNSLKQRGYGEGCNLGAMQAKGRYLVFMNPDIETTPESIQRLIRVLEEKTEIGLVGPQILRPDGAVEISCCAEPKPLLALVEYSFLRGWPILRRFAKLYRLNGFDHRSSRIVPIISGSCLAMRAEDFSRLGGFDKNIFLYFEEFDLAKRVFDQRQKSAYFCAEAVIIHHGQSSTRQLSPNNTHFRDSRRYWFGKAYGLSGRLVVKLLELMEH